MTQTQPGPDGQPRCAWCLATPEYVAYHDTDWGLPVADDRVLFEKLCLETFQSGLSWRTILDKREGFRRAFDGFDPALVAGFDRVDVQRLLEDPGIVRHRGKIEAAITNARHLLDLIAEAGSFAHFLWAFEPAEPPKGPGPCDAAVALSKALRKRGFAFVGPTTVHAFLQAAGLLNDHAEGCAHRAPAAAARLAFQRP